MTGKSGAGEPMSAIKPRFSDLVDLWRNAVDRAGERVALDDGHCSLTYREVWNSSHVMAARIADLGCQGGRVAIIAGNGNFLHVTYLASLLAGATPALVNPAYPKAQISALLRIASPKVVLCNAALQELLRHGDANEAQHWLSPDVTEWRNVSPARQFDAPHASDPGVLLFTGGTTGLSKGVIHSHAALGHAVHAMETVWPTRTTGEVWLPIAPMSHVYGFLMGVLNPVYGAAKIVIPSRFKPDEVLSLIERHRVTVFGGGPAPIYAALLASPVLSQTDLSSLKICPAGGAPTPIALLDRWKRETGLQIHEAYGMTEIAPITGCTPTGQRDGSVGRALPLNAVEIVDIVNGTQILAAGETGEIRARGPSAMTGYLGQPSETAATLRDGWVYTGDLGHLDEDGFLYVTDRKKNMVLVKGFNVFPRVVEEALLLHEDIREVVVVGVPDERTGERLVAFVVADQSESGAWKAHLEGRIADYMVPTEFRRLPAIPMTAANKPDRHNLTQLAKASVA